MKIWIIIWSIIIKISTFKKTEIEDEKEEKANENENDVTLTTRNCLI